MALLNILIILQIPSSPSKYMISSFCVKLIKVVKVFYSISLFSPTGMGERKCDALEENHGTQQKTLRCCCLCLCSEMIHTEINPLLEHRHVRCFQRRACFFVRKFFMSYPGFLHAVLTFASLVKIKNKPGSIFYELLKYWDPNQNFTIPVPKRSRMVLIFLR